MEKEENQRKEFVVLPTKAAKGINIKVSRQYAKMGLLPGALMEQNKVQAQLPDGWNVQRVDGGEWHTLVDDKGRVRARYFLSEKTEHSFIVFCCRYEFDLRPFDNYEDETVTHDQRRFKDWFGVITDCGEEIARTEPYKPQTMIEYERMMPHVLQERCEAYLQEHYPEHKDVNAYWD